MACSILMNEVRPCLAAGQDALQGGSSHDTTLAAAPPMPYAPQLKCLTYTNATALCRP
jgi:hypothetical protein